MSSISRLLGRRSVILHYTGHRILSDDRRSRFPAQRESEIAKILERLVRQERVGSGYGGLASGSDILFAETLLAAGADLHIVLACDTERFVTSSVLEAGQGWVSRFHGACAKAASVTICTQADDGPVNFGAATRKALDLGEAAATRVRSRKLQIAIFDGKKGGAKSGDDDAAGTGPDIERARKRGWDQIVMNPSVRGRIKPKRL